ncbi:hypothetical protein HONESTABE_189 [Bacillus phage HonestAbe]|uniref:hypothetical protein n=1 Tax=Bacillus phage Zuko TaxID=1805956 RepID=UPI0007A774B9|nr:hypothetical protein BI001_gp184 [Bacillus phage Zuko]AMW62519.1 hypothetical protein ZUKO_194 [Bacillus phage Zuko]ASR78909.1 hypothetical protein AARONPHADGERS_198 [Bacillus phage AaronPhadgers]AUV57826.1 hypothetical protein HONESTABE_189 [Bacillus phage HonestAbe]
MTYVDVALCIIAASIGVNYGLKLLGVVAQFKDIKTKGETPLYGTVLLGFGLTLAVEIIYAFSYTKTYFAAMPINYVSMMAFGISLYLIKNFLAHYTALGYWAIVVKRNEKKFKESLKRDIRKMGGEA